MGYIAWVVYLGCTLDFVVALWDKLSALYSGQHHLLNLPTLLQNGGPPMEYGFRKQPVTRGRSNRVPSQLCSGGSWTLFLIFSFAFMMQSNSPIEV